MWTRAAFAVGGFLLLSGCGTALQAGFGFSDTQTRIRTQTRSLRLTWTGTATEVRRRFVGESEWSTLSDPTRDTVTYQLEEVGGAPKSWVPFWAGTSLELVGAAALSYGAIRGRTKLTYGAVGLGVAAAVDAIIALAYLETRPPPGPAGAATPRIEYSVRVGDRTATATHDVRVPQHVHRLDFGGPASPSFETLTVEMPPRPQPEERWYGWQVLLVDGLAAGALALGYVQNNRLLMVGSATGLAVAGPWIHLANGQRNGAARSFVLRLSTSLVAAVVGNVVASIVHTSHSWELWGPPPEVDEEAVRRDTLITVATAAVVAAMIDGAVLAWAPGEVEDEPVEPLTVAPTLGVTPDGEPTLGLVGQF